MLLRLIALKPLFKKNNRIIETNYLIVYLCLRVHTAGERVFRFLSVSFYQFHWDIYELSKTSLSNTITFQ